MLIIQWSGPGSPGSQPFEFNSVSFSCSMFTVIVACEIGTMEKYKDDVKTVNLTELTVGLIRSSWSSLYAWWGWRKWWRSSSSAQMKKNPEHMITSASGKNLTKWSLQKKIELLNELTCQYYPASPNLPELPSTQNPPTKTQLSHTTRTHIRV